MIAVDNIFQYQGMKTQLSANGLNMGNHMDTVYINPRNSWACLDVAAFNDAI
jgi:hypothetical protein